MRIESSTAANSSAIRRRCPRPQIRVDDDDRAVDVEDHQGLELARFVVVPADIRIVFVQPASQSDALSLWISHVPLQNVGAVRQHGGGGALERLAGVAVDGDVRWGGHVGPSVLLTERGDEAVEGRHRPRVEPVVQVAGVHVHPVGSAERDEADVVVKSQRTRFTWPVLVEARPVASKFVHPAPMVTKIRGVGVPSTSSTKYVPGTSCSSGVPNSARGGVVGGTVTVGAGWSAGAPSSPSRVDHEDDRDHGGGRQKRGDHDPHWTAGDGVRSGPESRGRSSSVPRR